MKPDPNSLTAADLRQIADLIDAVSEVFKFPASGPVIQFPTDEGFPVLLSGHEQGEEDPLISGWLNFGESGELEFYPNVG